VRAPKRDSSSFVIICRHFVVISGCARRHFVVIASSFRRRAAHRRSLPEFDKFQHRGNVAAEMQPTGMRRRRSSPIRPLPRQQMHTSKKRRPSRQAARRPPAHCGPSSTTRTFQEHCPALISREPMRPVAKRRFFSDPNFHHFCLRPSFEGRPSGRPPQDEVLLLQQNQPHPEVHNRIRSANGIVPRRIDAGTASPLPRFEPIEARPSGDPAWRSIRR